jgi:hypothetical protein
METVTYMLGGTVEHGDNIGNPGTIGPGDIQWMTAGRGVIHQEMPKASKEKMHGLQLWVNLPAKDKMIEPRYKGILSREVPVVEVVGGEVRVIAGIYRGFAGPVKDLIVDVEYLDVRLKKGGTLSHAVKGKYSAFCYLREKTQRTDCLGRAHRHEHPGRARPGVQGDRRGDVYQEEALIGRRISSRDG